MHQEDVHIHSTSLLLKSAFLGWGMILLFVILNSYGSFILKNQVQKIGEWQFTSFRSVISYFFILFSSWKTWTGVGAISGGTGAWLIALNNLELSRAYPVAIGINLLITIFFSIVFFNESLSLSKILGVVLIMTGVIALFK